MTFFKLLPAEIELPLQWYTPSATSDPFNSSRRKIARAKEHLDDLTTAIRAFVDGGAYKQVVDEVGNDRFLRQTYISRAGHCAFTPAETIAAVETLITRLDTGRWPKIDAQDLNNAAAALGPNFNVFAVSNVVIPVAPAFIDFTPSPYLRTFDAVTGECTFGFLCGDSFFGFDLH